MAYTLDFFQRFKARLARRLGSLPTVSHHHRIYVLCPDRRKHLRHYHGVQVCVSNRGRLSHPDDQCSGGPGHAHHVPDVDWACSSSQPLQPRLYNSQSFQDAAFEHLMLGVAGSPRRPGFYAAGAG